MFQLLVKDRIMIAHSLKNQIFGPAQNLHGSTFEIECIFYALKLNQYNIILDAGIAFDLLKETLTELNYQNLDDIFPNDLTTTEFLSYHIWKKIVGKLQTFDPIPSHITRLQVLLHESSVMSAGYENSISWVELE